MKNILKFTLIIYLAFLGRIAFEDLDGEYEGFENYFNKYSELNKNEVVKITIRLFDQQGQELRITNTQTAQQPIENKLLVFDPEGELASEINLNNKDDFREYLRNLYLKNNALEETGLLIEASFHVPIQIDAESTTYITSYEYFLVLKKNPILEMSTTIETPDGVGWLRFEYDIVAGDKSLLDYKLNNYQFVGTPEIPYSEEFIQQLLNSCQNPIDFIPEDFRVVFDTAAEIYKELGGENIELQELNVDSNGCESFVNIMPREQRP